MSDAKLVEHVWIMSSDIRDDPRIRGHPLRRTRPVSRLGDLGRRLVNRSGLGSRLRIVQARRHQARLAGLALSAPALLVPPELLALAADGRLVVAGTRTNDANPHGF